MLKAFVFLATFYTSHGPVIYSVDHNLTGEDCVGRMQAGLTDADIEAMDFGTLKPIGDGDVPSAALRLTPSVLAGVVLSCEFDDYDD